MMVILKSTPLFGEKHNIRLNGSGDRYEVYECVALRWVSSTENIVVCEIGERLERHGYKRDAYPRTGQIGVWATDLNR